MDLSVIIPIYNVEQHLNRCLKSVSCLRVPHCEIILVDDASTDGSAHIARSWENTDSRFKLITHPHNRGLSAARNTGIDHAQGEWIAFIDSDDYLAAATLERNLRLARLYPQAQVIEFPISMHHGSNHSSLYIPGNDTLQSFSQWVHRRGYRYCYAWNKLYKRSLWHEIRFPEGRIFEDIYTIPAIIRQARYIVSSRRGLYYYCHHDGSISHRTDAYTVEQYLLAQLSLYTLLMQDSTLMSRQEQHDLYLRLCDAQIVSLQQGGSFIIPLHTISLRHALGQHRPLPYRVKALLLALLGKHYCPFFALFRKLMQK